MAENQMDENNQDQKNLIIDGIKERMMKMIDFSRKKALYAIWMESSTTAIRYCPE